MTSVSSESFFQWPVRCDTCCTDLLDQNNKEIGYLVSENERLHTYAETLDETFVAALIPAAIHRQQNPTLSVSTLQAISQGQLEFKATVYHEIIRVDPIYELLLDLIDMRSYYMRTQFYQPFRMRKQLGTHAGVSLHRSVHDVDTI
jgi:hypothetical protein